MSYDPTEQNVILNTFFDMLKGATQDGSRKRKAGLKQPWYTDREHEQAMFSHLSKWKHGDLKDKDSGAHPLVHLAWRALALAYQETYGKVEPEHEEIVECKLPEDYKRVCRHISETF